MRYLVLKKYFRNLIILVLFLTNEDAFGQKYQTKEIRITYSNGINIFNVCETNPFISFDAKKEYYWYSEISGFSEKKATEGGCGGNLLHGKEVFFDSVGSLVFEKNYNFGLLNGDTKYWDSTTGKLRLIYRYVDGKLTYRKWKTVEGWFEDNIDLVFTNGYKKRSYDNINNLISESIYKNDSYLIKEYYEYSNKIKSQYSTFGWCDTCMKGKYFSFYRNGNKKVEGQYDDSIINIRVGIWSWYNENGRLNKKEIYKRELQRWPNGEWKVTGGYFFDIDLKKWLKIGKWEWYDETGKFLYNKNFDDDIEIE